MTGLYISATGMISQNQKLNVISNNMANANTYGYKTEEATFKVYDETYLSKKDTDGRERIGVYNNEVYVDDITTDYATGSIINTDSKLDIALVDVSETGDASFIAVEKNGKQLLTRNGAFQLDVNRHLSTVNGGRILDENNKYIKIEEGVNVSIGTDGTIINMDTNEKIAKIKIQTVEAQNLGFIKQEGNGYLSVRTYEELIDNYGTIEKMIDLFDTDVTTRKMFKNIEKIEEIRDTGQVNILGEFKGLVKQSFLESSNVDMAEQMVDMINTQKSLQANSKAYSTIDELLDMASNGLKKS